MAVFRMHHLLLVAEVLVDIAELGDQGLDPFLRAVQTILAFLMGMFTEVSVVLDPAAGVVLGKGCIIVNIVLLYIINVVLHLVAVE